VCSFPDELSMRTTVNISARTRDSLKRHCKQPPVIFVKSMSEAKENNREMEGAHEEFKQRMGNCMSPEYRRGCPLRRASKRCTQRRHVVFCLGPRSRRTVQTYLSICFKLVSQLRTVFSPFRRISLSVTQTTNMTHIHEKTRQV
jgi:hypothetical protein